MARAFRPSTLAFDAIAVEGALIAPAMLVRIAQHRATGQSEADYDIPKGLTLRDEIARYFRIGQAMFLALAASETPTAAATVSFIEKLLGDVFGFTDIHRVGIRTLDERQFAVTLEAFGGRVPVVVVPPTDDLDRPSAHLTADGRRRSAASALQDWLNADEGALWGLCANGFHIRLVRDNASLTRPAYIEADVRRIFEGDDFADFAALWLLIHASRFGLPGAAPTDCALELWRDAGQKEGAAARDKLRDGVEAALLSLGTGFLLHSENTVLREKLRTGELQLPDFFGELLRLVYRLIFLFAAEDRNLLHPPETPAAPRKLYAEGYSVGSLRDRAVRRAAWDRHHDRWEGLLIAFTALERGEERLGLPALGGLFSLDGTPHLQTARLANRNLMEAIFRLAWLREPSGLVPVNWRDMETEELGSVYESLLELTPRLTDDGRGFAFAEGGEAKGHARKTSGSYYTPDSLVQALLDSALDPVLDRVEAGANDPVTALLSVKVLDPACGSGHFLLAAARRIATRLVRARAGGVAAPADYRHALRDVARACIHGVDRNPMAVELAKVALWIETVEPGKPLGFLDANIRCGDSLLGVFDLKTLAIGIPHGAYKPLAGDDKETAKHFEKRNKAEREGQGSLDFVEGGGRLPAAFTGDARALRAMPEDSPEEIAAKRKRFESSRTDPQGRNLRIAADLAIAAFLGPKAGGVPSNRNTVTIPTTAHVWDALGGRPLYGPLVSRAQCLAGTARAFHWPLEFPDIIATGGFDVVISNPPYVRHELLGEELKRALRADYAAFDGMADLYVYFFEQGFRLLHGGGRMSYVVTNKWLKAGYAEPLRDLLVTKGNIEFVADFGHAKHFFPDVDVFPSVVVVRKPLPGEHAQADTKVCVIPREAVAEKGLSAAVAAGTYLLPRAHFTKESWTLEPPDVVALLDKIRKKCVPLADYAGVKSFRGVTTGFNDAFFIDTSTRDQLVKDDPGCAEIIKPYLRGQDIERWHAPWTGLWMIFARRGIDIKRYPSVTRHLEQFRQQLEPKPNNWKPERPDEKWPGRKEGSYAWYEIQDSVEYWPEFDKPKIIYQAIQFYASYAHDESGVLLSNKAFFLPTSNSSLLAALNSPLGWWVSWRHFLHMKDEALSNDGVKIATFPVAVGLRLSADQIEATILEILSLSQSANAAIAAVHDWLRHEFGLDKLGRMQAEPHKLDAEGFVTAVRAALPKSRKWSAAEIARLKQEYANTLIPARKAAATILALERRLSDLVNAAYGLTPEDVALMWRTAPPRMPLEPVQELRRLDVSMRYCE